MQLQLQFPDIGLSDETWSIVLPPPKVNSFDWICEHVRLPPDNSPWDPDSYPWSRGICEAWDDPSIRRIWLQFAARVGKTALAMALMTCAASTAPFDSLYGTSTQDLAKQTIRLKYLPMLRATKITRNWLPPAHKILQTRLELAMYTLYVAWSGSVTTLADIGPKYKHAGEIDKWDRSESDEADPLPLFGERGVEHRDRKSIYESTPAVKGKSRIEAGRIRGSDCRFYCPCRKCRHHQVLVVGDNDPRLGGLVYDAPPDGSLDLQLAAETARYVCEECGTEHGDEHKPALVQAGIWAPRGQVVDKNGQLVGTAAYRGPEASYQLSRLYSRTFTWGELATEALLAKDDPELAQNFANSVLGETYELVVLREKWEDVAARLCGSHALGEAPDDVLFVARGCDVQLDHIVYWTAGWTSQIGAYCLDYGIAMDWSEMAEVVGTEYLDGRRAVVTFMDTRYRGSEVLEFAKEHSRRGQFIMPCAGSSGEIPGKMYRKTPIDLETGRANAAAQRKLANVEHITVNTPMTQNWVHWCLKDRLPGMKNSICMPASAIEDKDFWEQAMNEQPDTAKGRTKYGPARWQVADENIPVDFRDTIRYCRAAAEWYTRGKWERLRKRKPRVESGVSKKPPPPKQPRRQDKRRTADEAATAESTPEKRSWVRRLSRRR